MDNQTQKTDPMQWILAASLMLSGVFVVASIVMVNGNTEAATPTVQTNVQNVAPTIPGTIVISDSDRGPENYGGAGGTVTLQAGGPKNINIHVNAEDVNGAADIVSAEAKFFRAAVGSGAPDDLNDMYTSTCALHNTANPNEREVNCPVPLAFFADSTSVGGFDVAGNWTAQITVTDSGALTASKNQDREMGTLLAVEYPAAIDFGSVPTPYSSLIANNVNWPIQQFGNDEANTQVSMAATTLTCSTSGSIPRAQIKHSPTDVDYTDGTTVSFTNTPTDVGVTLGYRTIDGTPLTDEIYYNLEIVPADGASGTCSNPATVTAVAA